MTKLTPHNAIIVKVSNYGTSHPVIARLLVQTNELLKWSNLDKNKKQEVFGVYEDLKNRLLKCCEIIERLESEFNKNIAEEHFDDEGKLKSQPFMTGLQGEIESFLYEGKNILRECLKVINIFFGTNFSEASCFWTKKKKFKLKLSDWAHQEFGGNDEFFRMLMAEEPWTSELIKKRNAVEHPGEQSGTLKIENFTLTHNNQFLVPLWHREFDGIAPEKTAILDDLVVFLCNLLTFSEDLLVNCIRK